MCVYSVSVCERCLYACVSVCVFIGERVCVCM